MPSKKYNGNSPLQGLRLGSFADVELEVAKRSPRQALTTGVLQTPSGAIHTPKRRRRSKAGTTHPWRVSLSSDAGNYTARILEGRIFDGLLSVNEIAFDTQVVDGVAQAVGQNSPVDVNDVVCIKYTYAADGNPATIKFTVQPAGVDFADWEATEETGDPAVVTATFYPLAKIVDKDDSTLEVQQMATSHLVVVPICYNGQDLTTFTPH